MAQACVALAEPTSGQSLRVAVHAGSLRDVSREDLDISLKMWATEVSNSVGVSSDIRFYQTMTEIHSGVEDGSINFVIADAISMLEYFTPDELADGFGSVGKDEDSMVLVARKQASVTDFKSAAGKRFVLLADNEISDVWLETACLRVFHQRCAQASIEVSKAKRSQQQVLKLFFNKADVALVRSRAYELAMELNPQIREQIRVVERIRIYPGALGLFSRRVSPEFREYVISKVPLIQTQSRGKQLMMVLQTEQLGRVSSKHLEPIKALLREHELLSKRYQEHAHIR